MRRAAAILAVFTALASIPDVDLADAQGLCLTRKETRAAVKGGLAARPGRLGKRLPGKVLRMDLCRGGAGLVWVVTMLRGDGRVVEVVVDAQSAGR